MNPAGSVISPTIGVVMVTYNVCDLASAALSSLIEDATSSQITTQIVVVDNASSDEMGSILKEKFPQIISITNAENIGFAAANNQGLRALGFWQKDHNDNDLPHAVYLLNPDTITHPGATAALWQALQPAPIGLVGARLQYGDGSHQHSAFRFPGLWQLWAEFGWLPGRMREGRTNGRYPLSQYQGEAPFSVNFVLGATMMLRSEVVQQVGGLDEEYVMYCEEIDWAWRIQQAGWQVQCVPEALVTHLGGRSSEQLPASSTFHLWNSRLKLYDRIHPRWKRGLARRLIRFGIRRRLRQMQVRTEADRALASRYRELIQLADSISS